PALLGDAGADPQRLYHRQALHPLLERDRLDRPQDDPDRRVLAHLSPHPPRGRRGRAREEVVIRRRSHYHGLACTRRTCATPPAALRARPARTARAGPASATSRRRAPPMRAPSGPPTHPEATMLFVSGTKRSGTTMWIQVLRAAGFPILGEALPRGFSAARHEATPPGYYESLLGDGVYFRTNPHPLTDEYFLPEQVEGYVVKVFVAGVLRSERAYISHLLANVREWREYE